MGKKIRCLGCMFQPVSNIHVCEGGLGGCELDDMDLLCTLECKHVYSVSGHKHGGKLAAQTWLEHQGLSKSRSKSSSTRDSLEIRYQASNRGKSTDRIPCLPGPCHLTRPCTRYNLLEICPIHFQFCSVSSFSSPSLPVLPHEIGLDCCRGVCHAPSLSLDNHSNPENHANEGTRCLQAYLTTLETTLSRSLT